MAPARMMLSPSHDNQTPWRGRSRRSAGVMTASTEPVASSQARVKGEK